MTTEDNTNSMDLSLNKTLNSIENLIIKDPSPETPNDNDGVQITCFSDVFDEFTLHFQILKFPKQIYAWVGCKSAKFGNLYAAGQTRPTKAVSVTSIFGGTSDITDSSIARRLVLKTGLNIILACNIPKNNPLLKAEAEKKLVQKLIGLDYTIPKSEVSTS